MGPKRLFLYLCACTGNLLVIAGGMSLAWSSPVIPKLETNNTNENPLGRPITFTEASWIGCTIPLGAMVGSIIASIVSLSIGKKYTAVFFGGIPCAAAFLALAFANDILHYYICRVVIGIALGAIYTVVPQYNGEIAETEVRGKICSLLSTFETSGELLVFGIGPLISVKDLCLIIFGVTIIASFLIFTIIPKSPVFLLRKNDIKGAEAALLKLRAATDVNEIMAELQILQNIIEKDKVNAGKWSDIIFVKATRKAQIITAGLVMFQQSSGLMPVIFYAQTIFIETGSDISPKLCVVALGSVQVATSFITPNIVDRLGRKPLLCISALGMGIGHFVLGWYFHMKKHGNNMHEYNWLPIACLVLYMFSYYIGFGPIPWTIMGEIFPSNMKTIAYMISVVLLWLTIFINSKYFYVVAETVGAAICFWFFGICCILAIFFTVFVVIETSGKSFQEIQTILNN